MAERELAGVSPRRWLDVLAVVAIRLAGVLTAPLLLFIARTWRGRAVGVIAWSYVLFLGWWWMAGWAFGQMTIGIGTNAQPSSPQWVINAAMLGGMTGMAFSAAVAGVTTLVLLFTPPAYRSGVGPGPVSLFLGPTWLHRWQMVLPPEEDAVWLGAWVVSRFDPWMSRADARALRGVVRALLDELAECPEYRTLAPAHALAVWGKTLAPDHGHFYVYTPTRRTDVPLGLLIALHGHGPNPLLWLHAWRDFADEYGFAVVCPSFGYGNWEHPDGVSAVGRCLAYALAHFPVDPARVYLAGISQGGAGVARAGAAFADRLAGLIFLSPTLEPGVLDSPAFAAGWAGRPVFVAQGGRDHNVPPAGVDAGVAVMKRAGVDVTYHVDPGEDHFLFFARRDELHRRIGEWAGGQPTP